jgi:5'(3')-deoxyribonucleotidase
MTKYYVDLDGVLTDFTKQLCDLLGKPLDRDFDFGNDPNIWKKIDSAGEDFWSQMEWMPDGKDLWEEVSKYSPTILTSPSNHKSSIEGKKKWLEKNLPGVPFIIEQKKDKYADPDAILIDDRDKNINAWNKAGGIGIKHTSTPNTIKGISKTMEKKTNTKKACLSFILRKAAASVLSGKYDTSFEEFLRDPTSFKPSMMGEYSPEKPTPKKKTLENFYLFESPNPAKMNLTFNVLEGLFKKLDTEGGGLNQKPKSELRKLINLLKDNSKNKLSELEKDSLRREIRTIAGGLFPDGHPKSKLNWDVLDLVLKAMSPEKKDLTELSEKINPRSPDMRGDRSYPKIPHTLKWASEKIVEVAKNIMLRKASLKKINLENGKKVTIPAPRLHETTKPPKVIKPAKGGSYKRDKTWTE